MFNISYYYFQALCVTHYQFWCFDILLTMFMITSYFKNIFIIISTSYFHFISFIKHKQTQPYLAPCCSLYLFWCFYMFVITYYLLRKTPYIFNIFVVIFRPYFVPCCTCYLMFNAYLMFDYLIPYIYINHIFPGPFLCVFIC